MTVAVEVEALVRQISEAADAKKAENLVALDVSDLIAWTDVLVIASAPTERLVVAIADAVEEKLRESGTKPFRTEGRSEGRWVLLDFGGAIVHVMHEEERHYYALERLWSSAPVLPLALNS